jgi:hypothetical protein
MSKTYSKWVFKHFTAQTTILKAYEQKLFSAEWTKEKLEKTVKSFNRVWNDSKSYLSQYGKLKKTFFDYFQL